LLYRRYSGVFPWLHPVWCAVLVKWHCRKLQSGGGEWIGCCRKRLLLVGGNLIKVPKAPLPMLSLPSLVLLPLKARATTLQTPHPLTPGQQNNSKQDKHEAGGTQGDFNTQMYTLNTTPVEFSPSKHLAEPIMADTWNLMLQERQRRCSFLVP